MDKLKGLADKFKGGSSSGTTSSGSAGQEDYLDKAVDSIEAKTGHQFSREQNEKATDSARDFIEKKTGKNIPDKISN